MKWINNLDYDEMVSAFSAIGEPKYRADQVCQWVYKKRVFDFGQMTNLSLVLRERLASEMSCAAPQEAARARSKHDGTVKFLWRLGDGECVESVLLEQSGRHTACISTQVGCPLGCLFCATGQSGFVRNLSSGEIAMQMTAMEAVCGDIQNLVVMGMGEPMLNFDALMKGLSVIRHPKMRGLGTRHIVVSTAGIVPGIDRFAAAGGGVRLAVSLHSADQAVREVMMPVTVQYPLTELKAALRRYQDKTGDRIGIEYALFDGINDDGGAARGLASYLQGIGVYVNLIPANRSDNPDYRRPPVHVVEKFRQILELNNIEVAVRSEKGSDIDAACGQLRAKRAGK